MKSIEQCETTVSFSKLGKDRVFEENLLKYRKALAVTKDNILDVYIWLFFFHLYSGQKNILPFLFYSKRVQTILLVAKHRIS